MRMKMVFAQSLAELEKQIEEEKKAKENNTNS